MIFRTGARVGKALTASCFGGTTSGARTVSSSFGEVAALSATDATPFAPFIGALFGADFDSTTLRATAFFLTITAFLALTFFAAPLVAPPFERLPTNFFFFTLLTLSCRKTYLGFVTCTNLVPT
jgi:hypothetical protein